MSRLRTRFNFKTRQGRQQFYQSTIWRRFRHQILLNRPWCVDCRSDDRVTAAKELDHIQALVTRPDLALDPNNMRPLCKSCHSTRTAAMTGGRSHR